SPRFGQWPSHSIPRRSTPPRAYHAHSATSQSRASHQPCSAEKPRTVGPAARPFLKLFLVNRQALEWEGGGKMRPARRQSISSPIFSLQTNIVAVALAPPKRFCAQEAGRCNACETVTRAPRLPRPATTVFRLFIFAPPIYIRSPKMEEENELVALRREKLDKLRARGVEPFG